MRLLTPPRGILFKGSLMGRTPWEGRDSGVHRPRRKNPMPLVLGPTTNYLPASNPQGFHFMRDFPSQGTSLYKGVPFIICIRDLPV